MNCHRELPYRVISKATATNKSSSKSSCVACNVHALGSCMHLFLTIVCCDLHAVAHANLHQLNSGSSELVLVVPHLRELCMRVLTHPASIVAQHQGSGLLKRYLRVIHFYGCLPSIQQLSLPSLCIELLLGRISVLQNTSPPCLHIKRINQE